MAKRAVILFAILNTLLLGCGGTVWEEAYFPVLQTIQAKPTPAGPYKIDDKYNHFILGDDEVEITVFRVLLSEKSSVVFGPGVLIPTPGSEVKTYTEDLMIMVGIKVYRGTVSLNTLDAVVKLDGRDQLHRPKIITKSPPGTKHSEEVSGIITLSATHETPILRFLHFSYDIPKTDLGPFALHFGELQLNGSRVTLPKIDFERRGRYAPR